MDTNEFIISFADALPGHVADHNATNSPQTFAASLSTVTDALGNAQAVFCKDFPLAYAAIKKYSGLLSWVPGLGSFVPVILAALTAVNTTVVPVVCAPPTPKA